MRVTTTRTVTETTFRCDLCGADDRGIVDGRPTMVGLYLEVDQNRIVPDLAPDDPNAWGPDKHICTRCAAVVAGHYETYLSACVQA